MKFVRLASRLIAIVLKFGRLASRLIVIVFNLVVALFLLGVGFIGWMEGHDVNFDLVPGVEPENMALTLIGLALFALLAVALSLKRSKLARMLMLLWNLLVSGLLVCAFARPSYKFDGMEHLHHGIILFLISLIALWGSWTAIKQLSPPTAKS